MVLGNLNKNTIDTSQSNFVKLSIDKIYNYDDYANSKDLIRNLVGTKEIDIDSFAIGKISYSLDIYGNFDSLIKEISDSNFMKITNIEYSNNSIELELVR